MPKVLRIINRFNLGGISYNVSYLSKYMPSDYETLLIGGPEEAGEESSLYIPHSLGLRPLVVKALKRSLNPINDYKAYLEIKKIIREFQPDIVHTHASKAGAIGRLAAIHTHVPIIVHTFHGHVFQGYFSSFVSTIFKSIERFLAKKSQAIVAISQIQKRELAVVHHICKEEKITVIPLGFDLSRFTENQETKRNQFREQYQLKKDVIAIGIIGRLAPVKNHYLFIDAILSLSLATEHKFQAFIIGDGETKEELVKYLISKNISYSNSVNQTSKIIFTSWIKEIDVALAGLDLICLSSKNEGTPVSLIEAQAAGKFIVSTDVGGIKDILHSGCGLLSPEGDIEFFRKNLLFAVNHFDEVKINANTGSEEVMAKFSYQRLCADMDQLYKKLLFKKN